MSDGGNVGRGGSDVEMDDAPVTPARPRSMQGTVSKVILDGGQESIDSGDSDVYEQGEDHSPQTETYPKVVRIREQRRRRIPGV